MTGWAPLVATGTGKSAELLCVVRYCAVSINNYENICDEFVV